MRAVTHNESRTVRSRGGHKCECCVHYTSLHGSRGILEVSEAIKTHFCGRGCQNIAWAG